MNLAEYMANMDTIGIGLWITGFMMVLIVIGVRVAFAAALAGFAGLLWVFAAKHGFERGLLISIKMAGTIPHSKVSTLALSLIPTFILIGYLAYYAGLTKALFEAAKRWVGWLPGGMGGCDRFFHRRFCSGFRCLRGNLGGICPYRDPGNVETGL